MHTTRALGRLGLRGDLRLWRIAALCGLSAAITVAAVGSSPAHAASKDYKICTYTSNITDAGTDNDVEVRLYGTNGTSSKLNLDNSNDNFERGKTDCFGFLLEDLGTMIQLALDVDCEKCWRLDGISVQQLGSHASWWFPYYNWVPDKIQYLGAVPL
jgi:hypothetical protein